MPPSSAFTTFYPFSLYHCHIGLVYNQEDYDPSLVLIADNIDSDKAKVLENSKDIRKEITKWKYLHIDNATILCIYYILSIQFISL
jgi:hypothetical protein